MIIVRILFFLFIIFAAYLIIDVIIPAVFNKQPFTLFRWIFKGKDYDKEIEDYNSSNKK